jgi:RecQ family ATP-dependent DNA helicase
VTEIDRPEARGPDPTEALRRHFGHPAFRPGQRAAVDAALAGRDVLIVMPTGAGKSLCYQLPALVDDRLAVVVSPLVSLMTDQVESLGGAAALINAQRDAGENRAALERALTGQCRLLYVAPERFGVEGFAERLAAAEIGLFVVDEAHCISQWGHDFRPDYMRLGDVAKSLGARSIVAATATATPQVAHDIARRLDLRDPVRIATGFERPNLSYDVVPARSDEARRRATLALLRDPSAWPAIVYAGTRKKTDETAAWLERELRVIVSPYHAGMDREPRAEAQRLFMNGDAPIVVATNAFGMGVDKANVRTVLHVAVPSSLEAYYQEAGRGGRDGLPSRCVLLDDKRDKRLHVYFINRLADEEAKRPRWREYRDIWGFVEGERCRRESILRHFGDRTEPAPSGRCCDVCDGPLDLGLARPERGRSAARGVQRSIDGSVHEAIVAVVEAASPSVGRTRCVEILRGGRSKVIVKYGYDELPGYGDFNAHSSNELLAEVDGLIDGGRLRSTGGRFPKLALAEAA